MRKIKILLIEDDVDDVELLEGAIRDNRIDCDIQVIMEGDKVMPYLENEKPNDLPDIIVMDFNLPKLHGREILLLIRASEIFSKIPIMVLTTSASPHDLQFAHEHGADKFITKPSTIEGFNDTVETIVSLTALSS